VALAAVDEDTLSVRGLERRGTGSADGENEVQDRAANAPHTRIAILGHYHGGNLGDDLTVAALVQNLWVPGVELVGFSNNPADTTHRHGIPAFPVQRVAEGLAVGSNGFPEAQSWSPAAAPGSLRGRLKRIGWLHRLVLRARRGRAAARAVLAEPGFLWRSYRRLRGVDCVIVAGSHPFSDSWSGPWGHPYLMLRWAVLARLAGARFIPFCVGAGPVRSRSARLFLRVALRLSDDASFRDEGSARTAREELGLRSARVLPDLVFSLDLEVPHHTSNDAPRSVVGLNPMSLGDPRYQPGGDAAQYAAFVGKLAEFAAWLLRHGHDVRLFSSETRADPRVFADLRARIEALVDEPLAGRITEASIEDGPSLIETLLGCDLVVATRYHSILLSHLVGRPTLALAYHPKTTDLLKMLGSEDCLDAGRFEASELIEAFEALRKDPEQRVLRVQRAIAPLRDALRGQYHQVLEALARSR
jgi:polysaccharide pyruvyl transferase WcaK-like protein